MSFIIFTDFDGTITQQDSLAQVLYKFADSRWLEIEDRVTAGELTDRQALQAQFDLLNVSLKAALEVVKEIPIDDSFPPFYHFCQQQGWPLIVLSGGFESFIQTILKRRGLEGIPFHANRVIVKNNRWKVVPNPGPKINNLCNNCKTYWVQFHRKVEYKTVYIGDGNTDRCPIIKADIRFAKGNLAKFLTEQGIPFLPYNNFADVQRKLQLIAEKKTISREQNIEETLGHCSH